MNRESWNDAKTEQILGQLLISGVLLAAFTVLLGGIIYLFRDSTQLANYHVFQGEPAALRGFLPVVRDAVHLHSKALIQLGLILLIATPVARVIFSVFAFAMEGDRTYVVITLIVLAILSYSFFGRAL